jgi:opacity protein-like surface antigen
MKRKMSVLGVAALVALLALSGVAQSAMWVGAELGGNFNLGVNTSVSAGPVSGSLNTEVRPSVIGGATIGYDFVNSGFGAANYPSWMQYFSFAMDITYNRLTIQDHGPGIGNFLAGNSRINGWEFAWTFLFMAHYGFLRDSEVPSGRINPYIGVGPAIVWTGVEGTAAVPYRYFNGATGTNPAINSRFGDTTMNVALVVEPGIRWMCMKNVSVDTAMRYRYSVPSWSDGIVTVKANPLHQIAFLIRANYHF